VILAPYVNDLVFSRDPDDWFVPDSSPYAPDYCPHIASFLQTVRVWAVEASSCMVSSSNIASFFETRMRESAASHLAVEAEKKAHEAILDAVLALK
jgi:hypothetical protein